MMSQSAELSFRIGMVLLVFLAVAIQYYFGRRGGQKARTVYKIPRDAARREGRWLLLGQMLTYAVISLWAGAYAANPRWVAALAAPLGVAWRRTGLGLGFVSLVALFAVHLQLGRNWSPYLTLRDDHQLVTTGIYQRVRHPMYTVIIVHMVAIGLTSGDWLVMGLSALRIILIHLRVGREEALLVERFGDEYRRYIEATPRFIPRL